MAPDVALEIDLNTPGALEARVTDGTMDVAIVPVHRQSSSLTYTPLYVEHMTLYCGEGHPLFDAPPTLTAEQFNLRDYKYAGYAFNSPNMKAGASLGIKRAAKVQEEEALALLVQSGRYLGFLADHVADTLVAKGRLRPLASQKTSYSSTFAAITRKKPRPDRKTLEFVSCLKRYHDHGDANARN